MKKKLMVTAAALTMAVTTLTVNAVSYDTGFQNKVTPVTTYSGKDYTLLHSDGSDQYNPIIKNDSSSYELAADSVKIGNDIYTFVSTTYGIQVYRMYNTSSAVDTRKNAAEAVIQYGVTEGYTENSTFAPYYTAQTGSVSTKPYVQTKNYLQTVNDSVKVVTITENGTEKIYLYYTCLYNCAAETEGENAGKYLNNSTGYWNPCVRKIDVTNPLAPVETAVFVQNDTSVVTSKIYCDQRYYNKIIVDTENGYIYALGRDNQNKSNGIIGAYYKDQNPEGDNKVVSAAGYFNESYMSPDTDFEYSNGWLYALKLGANTEFAVTPYKLDVATKENPEAALTKYNDVYLPLSVNTANRAVRGIEANDNNVFVAFVNSDNTDTTANDINDGIIVFERTPDSDYKLNPVTRITIPEMTHSVKNNSTLRFGSSGIAMSTDGKILYVSGMKTQSVLGINVENINKPYLISTVRLYRVDVSPNANAVRNSLIVTDNLMFSIGYGRIGWSNNIDTVGSLLNNYTISDDGIRMDSYYKYMSYYTSNTTDTEVKSKLIYALYDANMNLIDVKFHSPVTTSTDGKNLVDKVYNAAAVSTNNAAVKYVKAFMWNMSENEMLPILPLVAVIR